MEPRLVSFAEMRTPEIIGSIGGKDQLFLSLSQVSTDWDKYVVEMAFIPAVKVRKEDLQRPSLKDLSNMSKKFEKTFVGEPVYISFKSFIRF